MDDCFRIPFTKIRFGLDPILGLFPGMGDSIAAIVGVAIIGEANRRGITRRTQLKMAGNILANAAVGTVPGLGDAFSVWFKSNRKNYEILEDALQTN